jgi:hypothetical protein
LTGFAGGTRQLVGRVGTTRVRSGLAGIKPASLSGKERGEDEQSKTNEKKEKKQEKRKKPSQFCRKAQER